MSDNDTKYVQTELTEEEYTVRVICTIVASCELGPGLIC